MSDARAHGDTMSSFEFAQSMIMMNPIFDPSSLALTASLRLRLCLPAWRQA